MNICMAGIDFGRAALGKREAFAFTRTQAARAMRSIARMPGMDGCVLVSTCNRTELWLCAEDGRRADPAELLCSAKGLEKASFSDALTVRNGMEAVRHLFETACGMRSLIWGEDQIVTQIRNAADLSVAEGAAGKVLGKLFQTAVTSAKAVKTRVRFASGDSSVAAAAVEKCRALLGGLKGLRCLVIGSGEMGRLTAQAFAVSGAETAMTLRQYKYGISVVPDNCASVPYDERYAEICGADIVVSATSSPHFTLLSGPVGEACAADPKDRIFIDLAVPRDMDRRIAELPGCRLITVDDIPCGVREEEKAAVESKCGEIIDHYIGEFKRQLIAWSTLPEVQKLTRELQVSLCDNLEKELERTAVSPEDMRTVLDAARKISGAKAGNMLFAFRDWMEENAAAREMPPGDAARAAE